MGAVAGGPGRTAPPCLDRLLLWLEQPDVRLGSINSDAQLGLRPSCKGRCEMRAAWSLGLQGGLWELMTVLGARGGASHSFADLGHWSDCASQLEIS